MIIFNHNLIFLDEKILQDDIFNPKLKTITISEDNDLFDSFIYVERSDWVLLSTKQARYYSTLPLDQSDKHFSWSLEIKDIVTLAWDTTKETITYKKGINYTPYRLRFWIFHTFFPLLLELERIYHILHVGSIEIDGKPIFLSAPSMGGKSTLTDYFIKKGHTMLCDDACAIKKENGQYMAISSYPFSRPYREPETLGESIDNFSLESKPLHAIYLLEKSGPKADIEVSPLRGVEKFKLFHYSSFVDFSSMKKERFEFFSNMSKEIPAYRVTVPWDLERLEEVYRCMISKFTMVK